MTIRTLLRYTLPCLIALTAAGTAHADDEAAPDGMGHRPGVVAPPEPGDADPHASALPPGHPAIGEDDTGPACAMDMDMEGHGHGGPHGHGDRSGATHGMAHAGCHAHHHGGMTAHTGLDEPALVLPEAPEWLDGITLTADQQDRILAVLTEHAVARQKALRTLHETHAALHHIGLATDYSEASTRTLAERLGQSTAELARLDAQVEHRILQALTAEQRHQAAHQAAGLE